MTAGTLFFFTHMATQAEKEYADLMIEINECLKTLLYQTDTTESQTQSQTQTQSQSQTQSQTKNMSQSVTQSATKSVTKTENPKRVAGTLLGVRGRFSRRLITLKTPHCAGCNKPVNDEINHRECITAKFKRNSIAWKKATYLATPQSSRHPPGPM